MMTMVSGTVHYHGVGFVMIVCQGIGYKVMLPESAAQELRDEVALYTHEVIRENERELFGFRALPELELFWRLITVSGVGPKSAQKIVYAAQVNDVKSHIMSGNVDFLRSVPGIGMKTAQKIILELKGALADEPTGLSADPDAVSALVGLGYSRKQAEEAIGSVEAKTTDDRIRLALKGLGRRI